jgi:hypothetical protein
VLPVPRRAVEGRAAAVPRLEGRPGRESHSITTVYISFVILRTKFTGWRQNDFGVHGYAKLTRMLEDSLRLA